MSDTELEMSALRNSFKRGSSYGGGALSNMSPRGAKALATTIVAAVTGLGSCAFQHATKEPVCFTVTGKGIKIETHSSTDDNCDDNGNNCNPTTTTTSESIFLVHTTGETFENRDSWSMWKFGSEEMQGRLKNGVTYKGHVTGERVPALKWHRNIIEAEPDTAGTCPARHEPKAAKPSGPF